MTQNPNAKIILEGITVEDFFTKLQEIMSQSSPQILEKDENLNVEEAAKFLKLSEATVHRLKADNKIPFTKIGARVIYRRSQLTEWMDQKTNGLKVRL